MPSSVPIHILLRVLYKDEIASLAHRKPYLSCIKARTELDDSPSSTEK